METVWQLREANGHTHGERGQLLFDDASTGCKYIFFNCFSLVLCLTRSHMVVSITMKYPVTSAKYMILLHFQKKIYKYSFTLILFSFLSHF